MALIKINGRSMFLDCDSITIEKVGNGRWVCDYGRAKFDIIGRKASGGAANEWFVRNVEFFGNDYLRVKSMRAAVKLGVQF